MVRRRFRKNPRQSLGRQLIPLMLGISAVLKLLISFTRPS
uniref:Uncharacterized protein n=1 Tax=Lepeophtheirus salmonis TaxID=72036 RepID=A0A0K2VHQ4_LEPSM